jgi:uncharacterized protein (TIGR02301 family)
MEVKTFSTRLSFAAKSGILSRLSGSNRLGTAIDPHSRSETRDPKAQRAALARQVRACGDGRNRRRCARNCSTRNQTNDGQLWRERMQELLNSEGSSALRRAKLSRVFNQGYRSYSRTYLSCTPSAQTTITRFLTEGAQLSDSLVKSAP